MGVRGPLVFSHAPWLWLYVSATLLAVFNSVMAYHAYQVAGDEWGVAIVYGCIGLLFGHLSVVALWSAWGPATWLANYFIGVGSIVWMLALTFAIGLAIDDETPRIAVMLETPTMAIVFVVLAVVLHLARRFNRWRWQRGSESPATGRVQISLRAIFVATAVVAVLLTLGGWWIHFNEWDLTFDNLLEFAAICGMISLLVGIALVAPLFLFFACVHRRWRLLYAGLAVGAGYAVPIAVMFFLPDWRTENYIIVLGLMLGLQYGAVAAFSLEFGMLYAAGMHIVRLPRRTASDQRSDIASPSPSQR